MRKTLTLIFSTSCRPCSHVTETQGFVQQKKNWKASENVQKSEITL